MFASAETSTHLFITQVGVTAKVPLGLDKAMSTRATSQTSCCCGYHQQSRQVPEAATRARGRRVKISGGDKSVIGGCKPASMCRASCQFYEVFRGWACEGKLCGNITRSRQEPAYRRTALLHTWISAGFTAEFEQAGLNSRAPTRVSRACVNVQISMLVFRCQF